MIHIICVAILSIYCIFIYIYTYICIYIAVTSPTHLYSIQTLTVNFSPTRFVTFSTVAAVAHDLLYFGGSNFLRPTPGAPTNRGTLSRAQKRHIQKVLCKASLLSKRCLNKFVSTSAAGSRLGEFC